MKLALDFKRIKQPCISCLFSTIFQKRRKLILADWLDGWLGRRPQEFQLNFALTSSSPRLAETRGEATSMEVSSLFYTPLFLTSRTPERFSHERTPFFPSTQNDRKDTRNVGSFEKKIRIRKDKKSVMPWAALSAPPPMELPLGHVLGERAKDLLTKIPRPPRSIRCSERGIAVLKSPHTREERNSPTSTVMNPLFKKATDHLATFPRNAIDQTVANSSSLRQCCIGGFFSSMVGGKGRRKCPGGGCMKEEGPKEECASPCSPLPPQMHTTKSCHSCPPQSGMELGEGRQRGNKTPGLGGGGEAFRKHFCATAWLVTWAAWAGGMDEGARIDTKKSAGRDNRPNVVLFPKPTKNIDANYSALLIRQTAGMSFCTGLDKEGTKDAGGG